MELVKMLIKLNSNAELKLAPHPKPSCVEPGHYDAIKVGPAFSLLKNDTGAALRILLANGTLDK